MNETISHSNDTQNHELNGFSTPSREIESEKESKENEQKQLDSESSKNGDKEADAEAIGQVSTANAESLSNNQISNTEA